VEKKFSANAMTLPRLRTMLMTFRSCRSKSNELNAKVTEDDNALFDSNRRHIKYSHKFSHDANEEFLGSLKSIQKTISFACIYNF